MRLSADVISACEQRPNPLGEREIVLRGLGVPTIEHLATTRDQFDAIDLSHNNLVRLENFPRLLRLTSLYAAGNAVEGLDRLNVAKNLPNLTNLILADNKISRLSEVKALGGACPKLEFLILRGNPVTRESPRIVFARATTRRVMPLAPNQLSHCVGFLIEGAWVGQFLDARHEHPPHPLTSAARDNKENLIREDFSRSFYKILFCSCSSFSLCSS